MKDDKVSFMDIVKVLFKDGDNIVIKVKTDELALTSTLYSTKKLDPQSELEKIVNRLQILET